MTATTKLTSTKIKAKLTAFEALLAESESRLPAALRATGKDYLAGEIATGIPHLRGQIRNQMDVIEGLRLLLADAELEELDSEIDRRQREHELKADRVAKLRDAANRGASTPEGVGPAFGAALRSDRADRHAAFAEYERANIAHI